ncbi:MAG: M20/M25/M40 family metallo-hydrolase, partial [Ornithinimicrobium sp.]
MTDVIPDALRVDLHDLYRHLHAHPELSMVEHETVALIESRMSALGYATTRCAGTGLIATMSTGPGPVIAFRADIDGLPVAEQSGLEYASAARGVLPDGSDVPVMHACGHDTHIAAAIGAAHLLANDLSAWRGTVIFLFQPGEETAVGAAAMVADDVWDTAMPDGRRPEVVYSQHVWPGR